ncbi:MAG: SGNH/GDSL hydrolase family protein [Trichodesmium sp. St15_bin1_1]|jgi:lysophospholipase L1-like esterase|nr:GDSL-type esterase/lipase family protein [Trichodesmium sp. MAG_R02]MDE5115688.1 SGNH/GDSL hydrolase family protein [Trichodesmium sp. St15_bin1_1]
MVFTFSRDFPTWVWCSLAANGLLSLTVAMLIVTNYKLPPDPKVSAVVTSTTVNSIKSNRPSPLFGEARTELLAIGRNHKWTYQQWVEQLQREAIAAANNRPERLTILVGDSLSLWFPSKLLPWDRNWLNQGISGETTVGLLKRLYLFDSTRPETIFVMIGINDLLHGVDNRIILANQRKIISQLRTVHPGSQIVVQSILPHSGESANWEGRDRLLQLSNSRIRKVNRSLKALADAEGAFYLNLYPLFTDAQGFLRSELSTDGLHLNDEGYQVWSTAIKMYSKIRLEQP